MRRFVPPGACVAGRTPFAAPALALLLALLGAGDASSVRAAGEASEGAARKIVRVSVEDSATLEALLASGLEPLACRPGLGESDWVVEPSDVVALRKRGIPTRTLIEDVEALLSSQREKRARARRESSDWYAVHRTLTEIESYLDGLAATYPQRISLLDLGLSAEGRTIRGFKIHGADAPGKPAVLFNGTQHAREWAVAMTTVFLIEALAQDYGTNALVQELLDAVDVYVVPMVNPDGYEYSHTTDRFWRKNRSVNPGSSCRGVDLNRNWGVDWNGSSSTSNSPCSSVFVGSAAFSEPETQVLRDFILAHPELKGHIDFHSYTQAILQPWGHTDDLPANFKEVDALGAEMSRALFEVHGKAYPHASGSGLLGLASGIFPDWTHARSIFGYTIEVRPRTSSEGGFELPPEQIRPTAEENYAAALEMIAWARPATCGNEILEAGEECDGSIDSACPGACTTATSATPCRCNIACGDGVCDPTQSETATTCPSDCAACAATPRSDCRASGTRRGVLKIVDRDKDRGDKLTFDWANGPAPTDRLDFGNPASSPGTTLRLCLYDSPTSGDPELLGDLNVGGGDHWRSTSSGFVYSDNSAASTGIRKIVLKAASPTRARLKIVARGENLATPTLPLRLPAYAQLLAQSEAGTTCWEAEFSEAQRNTPGTFKARSP